jgi:hypothetical protein
MTNKTKNNFKGLDKARIEFLNEWKPKTITPAMKKLVSRILEKDIITVGQELPSGLIMNRYDIFNSIKVYSYLDLFRAAGTMIDISTEIKSKYVLPDNGVSDKITYLVLMELYKRTMDGTADETI